MPGAIPPHGQRKPGRTLPPRHDRYLIIIRAGRLSGKEQEADGIGGEVGAEVYHPGEPETAGMLIQAAEDPPTQGQSSQSEELNRQTVPAEGHRHMVEGEGQIA